MTTIALARPIAKAQADSAVTAGLRLAVPPSAQFLLRSAWYGQRACGLARLRRAMPAGW